VIDSFLDQTPYQPLFLDRNPLESLSKFSIRNYPLTIATVATMAFFPQIETMRIDDIDDFDISSLPANCVPGTSSLLSIEFDDCFHLPEHAFIEVLRWPRALKRLRCNLPGRGVSLASHRTDRVGIPLSPQWISGALNLVGYSLVDLTLTRGNCTSPGHDGSRLDLSMMQALKTISVASSCFFRPGTEEFERGVYKLLPPTVESLKVCH
jgi:hypothetical protein